MMISQILRERQRHAEIVIQQILKAETLADLEKLKVLTKYYLAEDQRIKEALRDLEKAKDTD